MYENDVKLIVFELTNNFILHTSKTLVEISTLSFSETNANLSATYGKLFIENLWINVFVYV